MIVTFETWAACDSSNGVRIVRSKTRKRKKNIRAQKYSSHEIMRALVKDRQN